MEELHCGLQSRSSQASPNLRIRRAGTRHIHPNRTAEFLGPEGSFRTVIQHSRPPALGPEANLRDSCGRGLCAEETRRASLHSKSSQAHCPACHDLAGREDPLFGSRNPGATGLHALHNRGMRPGEIFGLKWHHDRGEHIDIEQRVYRGQIDSPKTNRSIRSVALSEGLQSVIAQWRALSGDPGPEAWVFPSETRRTPLSKDITVGGAGSHPGLRGSALNG